MKWVKDAIVITQILFLDVDGQSCKQKKRSRDILRISTSKVDDYSKLAYWSFVQNEFIWINPLIEEAQKRFLFFARFRKSTHKNDKTY